MAPPEQQQQQQGPSTPPAGSDLSPPAMAASPEAHGTLVAARLRHALEQVMERKHQKELEIAWAMADSQRRGVRYTGMTYGRLNTAVKGWKRAASKRAKDVTQTWFVVVRSIYYRAGQKLDIIITVFCVGEIDSYCLG